MKNKDKEKEEEKNDKDDKDPELKMGIAHEKAEHGDLYEEVCEAIEEGEEMDETEFFETIAEKHLEEHPGYYSKLKKMFPGESEKVRSKGY